MVDLRPHVIAALVVAVSLVSLHPGASVGADHGNGQPFEPEDPPERCEGMGSLEPILPTHVDPTGLVTGWPLIQIGVVMLADPYFVAAHPTDWRDLLEDLVADASAYFEAQVGLRLTPVLIDHLPEGSITPGVDDGRQRAIARGYMNTNHPDLDFDIVALILGADYQGLVAGQVECVHGAYSRDHAYLWSEYTDPRGPRFPNYIGSGLDLMQDLPLKVFMHEAAHLFAAHHHYTSCGPQVLNGRPTYDPMAVCGLMFNDIGLASFELSTTNRLVVRSFVEEYGIGTPFT